MNMYDQIYERLVQIKEDLDGILTQIKIQYGEEQEDQI
jgi:hypothetical protein